MFQHLLSLQKRNLSNMISEMTNTSVRKV